MASAYIEYHFSVVPKTPWGDILLANLQELPFESFLETDEGFKAYLPKNLQRDNLLESVTLLNNKRVKIDIQVTEILPENWNAIWESQYHPVCIGNECVIRADFHKKQDKKYELIINPKMSFGTGHHPTTLLMAEFVLETDTTKKNILDMGCGTGILGILASKKGAYSVDAVDIDLWCVENTMENAKANDCKNIRSFQSDELQAVKPTYDLIFANINRNTLTNQISSYSKALKEGGALYISGFYESDANALKTICLSENLSLSDQKVKETWCALKFTK